MSLRLSESAPEPCFFQQYRNRGFRLFIDGFGFLVLINGTAHGCAVNVNSTHTPVARSGETGRVTPRLLSPPRLPAGGVLPLWIKAKIAGGDLPRM